MGQDISFKIDLNHDLIFSAHTINCMCHSIRSMFRVLDHNLKVNFSSKIFPKAYIIVEIMFDWWKTIDDSLPNFDLLGKYVLVIWNWIFVITCTEQLIDPTFLTGIFDMFHFFINLFFRNMSSISIVPTCWYPLESMKSWMCFMYIIYVHLFRKC